MQDLIPVGPGGSLVTRLEAMKQSNISDMVGLLEQLAQEILYTGEAVITKDDDKHKAIKDFTSIYYKLLNARESQNS